MWSAESDGHRMGPGKFLDLTGRQIGRVQVCVKNGPDHVARALTCNHFLFSRCPIAVMQLGRPTLRYDKGRLIFFLLAPNRRSLNRRANEMPI